VHLHHARVIILFVIVTGRFAAALGVLAWAGMATAAPKKKVKIDSDPEGATVYFNSKEDGPVCTTPCVVDAPVGDTPIIVELENHKQLFENLVVSPRKPVTVKYKLVPAIGTIVVRGPAGAKIVVDDEDKGKAPSTFSVPAGSHMVVLFLDGKKIATQFVDVTSNDEAIVEGKAPAGGGRPTKPPPEETADPTNVEEDTTTGDTTADVTTSTTTTSPAPDRGPYVALSVAMDVGFRNFSYDNPQTDNLSPEKEGGQVLVGPVAEIWPGTLAGVRMLRGLSLLVRFGYGVNKQAVTQTTSGMTTSAKTYWQAFEISLRHRWTLKNAMTLEVGAGFVRDLHSFSGKLADIELVPDTDYRSIRLGGRASILLGSIEPFAAIENRIVLSGGNIEKRFDDASASGLRAALGAETKLGGVSVRVEGALTYYSWSFTSNEMTDKWRADGGTDSIKYITAAIGYAY
jgi:PEGA domain